MPKVASTDRGNIADSRASQMQMIQGGERADDAAPAEEGRHGSVVPKADEDLRSREAHDMGRYSIEISIKGKWLRVPALEVDGKNIILKGKWIKVAFVHAEEWLETEIEDPVSCVNTLKSQGPDGLRADVFTFSQKLPTTSPKYSYPKEWDSIAAIHVTSFKDWWEGLAQETRKNVRKAEKRGVVVQVKALDDGLLKDLLALNNDSPVRQGKAFTHYGKTLEQITRDQADFLDRCDYICAYFGEELIGVIKLIYRGDVASILTFLPRASHHDKKPANALIAKAVEICEKKQISYLTFGKFNYGNKQHTPLREFKTRNGFQEVLAPRYYVPLTMWGTIAVKLGLHRGLIGLLPHGMIVFLLNVRTKLQEFQVSRCSSTPEQPNRIRQMGRSIPPAGSKT